MTDKELMQDVLDTMEAAIKAGDWKVDGACDPDWVLNALRTRLSQCERCGEVNPAEIHTCTPDFSKAGFGKPQREEGCAECGKKSSDGWALYCVKCTERGWVGLTKKETLELLEKNIDRPFSLLVAVRDKLKEKNAPDL